MDILQDQSIKYSDQKREGFYSPPRFVVFCEDYRLVNIVRYLRNHRFITIYGYSLHKVVHSKPRNVDKRGGKDA